MQLREVGFSYAAGAIALGSEGEEAPDTLGPSSFSRLRGNAHIYSHASSRWGSNDFRRPFGHGKQGCCHLYSEDSAQGFMMSRSSDKILSDESLCPTGSCGDGKHGRTGWENRMFFGHKQLRTHSWETSMMRSGPGRPHEVSHESPMDNTLSYNSHPHSDFVNLWEESHLKVQHDKNVGANGLGIGPRFERENPPSSLVWKSLKRTHSGSLSSPGSGLTHSSSSKSMGVDSNEIKAELHCQNVLQVESPSGDATACLSSIGPSEDASSRKKRRLGWGEGLAKYEKKKVESIDDSLTKNGTLIYGSNTEYGHSHAVCLANKSPTFMSFDSASPATPSSVACSSSPGLEEKHFVKLANAGNDTNNLTGSPEQIHSVDVAFKLENFDLSSIASLSFSITELLQSDDPISDSCIGRSVAINKLLVWRSDISKALEMTESEIDSLEKELKSLISEPCCSIPWQPVSSAKVIKEGPSDAPVEENHEIKDEDIDSPVSATSKLIEPLGKAVSLDDTSKHAECCGTCEAVASGNLELTSPVNGHIEERMGDMSSCGDDSQLIVHGGCATTFGDGCLYIGIQDSLHNLILSCNRKAALGASEVFIKLLPTYQGCVDISRDSIVSTGQSDPVIKERFAVRKRFLRFKERVLALKFRAFQHLWREDMRFLSVRKSRAKSHKKFDLSLLTVQNGHKKNRSSIRSRFSSPAGDLILVPTSEVINFTSKLLSDSQVKLYRNTLKMPALILEKDKDISRFISCNGLVEDPCAVEKERSVINLWRLEEKEIFIEKLASFGKDFRKIASFFDQKTTADCVEFYYKNHKSEFFKKIRKPEFAKQGKSCSTNTYLVTSGKRWNREMNAVPLDMWATPSIAGNTDTNMKIQQKHTSKHFIGASSDYKIVCADNGILKRSNNLEFVCNERETVAADVLAGICGSLSSEALSSSITSSFDPGEAYQECKSPKMSYSMGRPSTPEVMQNIEDETCSNESCGEMDSADWTDEEKSIFMHALSSYGKDFDIISRCLRTRTRDQCRVFFSKARKVLGLDMIIPVPQNEGTPVSYDGNGGGSDADDACVLETGSVISSERSHSKGSGDLPISGSKVNDDLSHPWETMDLQHVSDENEETQKLNSKDTGLRSGKMVLEDCQVKGKQELVFYVDSSVENGICSNSVLLPGEEEAPIPSDAKARENEAVGITTFKESISGGTNDHSVPSRSNSQIAIKVVAAASADCSGMELAGQEFPMLESSLSFKDGTGDATTSGLNFSSRDSYSVPQSTSLPEKSLDCKDAGTCEADKNGLNTCIHDSNSVLQSASVTERSLTCKDDGTSDASTCGFNYSTQKLNSLLHPDTNGFVVSGHQYKTGVDFGSGQQPFVSLEQENCLTTTNSMPQESAACKYEKIKSYANPSVTLDLEKIDAHKYEKPTSMDNHNQHLTSHSSLGNVVELTPIFKGYPLLMSTKEMNGDISSKKPVLHQSISKLHKNFHCDHLSEKDCYLQRCRSRQRSKAAELPLLSQEQNRYHPRTSSQNSSDVEKPCRNGDFKLFGQILTHSSSQDNYNMYSDEKGAQRSKKNNKSFDLKFGGNHSVEGNSSPPRFDCNNYLALENIPTRSYCPKDEKRMSGFPSMPDSAILLAKYPAVLSHFPPSSKMEQQSLRALVNSSERSMNGGPVFPMREITVGKSLVDYQAYRSRDVGNVHPFPVDMHQPQSVLFSEMRRQNGFGVSTIQQAKGIAGIDVVERGVMVGGPCSGLSDPVAAIKMHYANNGQAAGVISEEDSRRGNGIGR